MVSQSAFMYAFLANGFRVVCMNVTGHDYFVKCVQIEEIGSLKNAVQTVHPSNCCAVKT